MVIRFRERRPPTATTRPRLRTTFSSRVRPQQLRCSRGAKPADAPPNVYDAHEVLSVHGADEKVAMDLIVPILVSGGGWALILGFVFRKPLGGVDR